MDNLAVTTSTFGTSDIVSTGTEYYPHVSQAQIANNTGYNYHTPKYLLDNNTYVTQKGVGTATYSTPTWYTNTGKYAIQYKITTESINRGGTVRCVVDGTTIFELISVSSWVGTTIYSSGTIKPSSSGWLGATFTAIQSDGMDGTTQVGLPRFFRQGI